jgi:hypothetical protein
LEDLEEAKKIQIQSNYYHFTRGYIHGFNFCKTSVNKKINRVRIPEDIVDPSLKTHSLFNQSNT